MFDEAVKVAASWDWVTPIVAMYNDWKYRPSAHIHWAYGNGSVFEAERLLKSKGVLCWGGLVAGDTCMVSVRKKHEKLALFLMRNYGFPV